MKNWLEPPSVQVSPELTSAIGGHPLLTMTLARRGLSEAKSALAFLDAAAYTPAPPFDLPDMDKAVERIQKAIQNDEKILVWGDFDVDGQTSTALLVSVLRTLGAHTVYYIPNRHSEGHGVHIPKLADLIASGVRLVVTCDTGISAHEAVDYAHSQGVDVVITDHHLLPPELPKALAAVNPQRLPAGHPLRTLPGVGCAYKLAEALITSPSNPLSISIERGGNPADRPYKEHELSSYLDLVALGIVADVAEQIDDTRYLLQRGLAHLHQTERLGLRVMIELAELNPLQLDEGHIGFALGPRLNALGRLDDANAAVELLTTHDLERARILANRVEALNYERRIQSDQVFKAAVTQIERDPTLLDSGILMLSHASWPGGIIGLVASRLVERYNRPVILLTISLDDFARGSARSISGIDITAALAQQSHLLTTFGGHTMAAGLSLPADRIPELRRALSRTIKALPGMAETTASLRIDGYLPLAELTDELVESLNRLAPFGPGNPPLVLATQKLTIKNQRALGRSGQHLRLTVEDEAGDVMTVLWWQAEPELLPKGRFDLAYSLRVNDFQGKRELQLEWLDARPVDEEPITFQQRAAVEIVDCREMTDSEALRELAQIQTRYISSQNEPSLSIWAEGKIIPELDGNMRHQLSPASTLVVWTAPPGATELRAALEAVNPAKVILFAFQPGTDGMQTFLQHFAGAVKFSLNQRGGRIKLNELAAVVGHRPTTARAGLEWMAARGHISIIEEADGWMRLAAGKSVQNGDLTGTTARLAQHLKETANYRAYFRRADKESLISM